MRRKLLLTVGLAILGACVTAGNAGAGGVGVDVDGVQANLPTGQDPSTSQVLPQCSNGADDDGDGVTDLGDPDCSGPLDTAESGSAGVPSTSSTTTPPSTTTPSTTTPGGDGTTTTTPPAGGDDEPVKPDSGVSGPSGSGGRGSGTATQTKPGEGDHGDQADGGGRPTDREAPRRPDGVPTDANPSLTVADFGPAPIGVPNFVIDQFTIPPFLLPIYQACGTQYGIPWQILASINRIETAFGTNLNVSTAGAVGWMQFMPSSWKMYGIDANGDGRRDPYNPYDAICAAARYLRAAGGQEDLRRAIFAYNHADWYVDEVVLYARQYGRLPDDLVGSLTGLTEGARFPVAADARYADDISERRALERSKPSKRAIGNAADVISSSPTRRGINIYSRKGAPVVAVNDGVITEVGKSDELGRYIVLRDAYGNRFTYAQLGDVSKVYPVPKQDRLSAADFKLVTPKADPAPDQPASAGTQLQRTKEAKSKQPQRKLEHPAGERSSPVNTEDTRRRLYAYPERPRNADRADLTGQLDELLAEKMPAYESFKGYLSHVLRFDPKTMEMRELEVGSKVTAGTVLGRIGKTDDLAPHLHFAIRPSGRGAPKIDPKPILDGWKLLEATAIYRAAEKNPFVGAASTSQVLLMSKQQLVQRALADPSLEIYACGRNDIRTGQIDRRLLAMLEYLTTRGYELTITSLKCGHSIMTASGNVSEHSSGNAVDIAQINGVPVIGHQGPGSLADALVRDLLQLQGTMRPHQIISLMDYFNADNTFAMADHADHVHVGYQPLYGPAAGSVDKQFEEILKPGQWRRLIQRLGEIDNPAVPTRPSDSALPAGKDGKHGGSDKKHRSSSAHRGE